MASSTPIYKAYVGVIPTAKGFGKNLEGELSNANLQGAANRAGDSAGRTLGSKLTSTFKSALKIGSVLTAAVGAAAVGGGISRQLNIEDAQKKLEALGHDTKGVETIMKSALDSVKGTAYGLDSAATQAAGAVAAGVKPGKDLTKYLQLSADAATIAGVSMDEMGFVMNKVQTGQQAYTEDLNMLADRGIPIFQWLQEEYGVTATELKKMVSDGKVDAQTYFKVIEENIGGAALKSGETTRGAFKNMLAALSRVGVSLTSGFFPLVREGFVGATTVLDAIGPKLEETFAPVWELIAPMFSSAISGMSGGLANWISNLDTSAITNFLIEAVRGVKAFGAAWQANDGTITSAGFPGFMERVANTLRGVWDELTGGIKAFGAAWQANDGDITSSGFPGFMESAAYWVRQVFEAFKGADYSGFQAFFSSLSDIKIPDLSGVADAGGNALGSIGESLGKIMEASPGILAGLLKVLSDVLGFLGNNMEIIAPLIIPLVAAFVAWKAASQAQAAAQIAVNAATIKALPLTATNTGLTLANTLAVKSLTGEQLAAISAQKGRTAATNAESIASTRATIAEKARTVATKIGAIASKAAAIATRALGAALRFATGPIGLIITGITLLVAGLIWFFTKTETGQKIWQAAWTAIKDSAAAVADWFMGTLVPIFTAAWNGIVAGAMWLYDNVIKVAWNGIKIGIAAVADWVMNSLVPWLQGAWTAIGNAAKWLYTNVIQPVWTGIKVAIAIVVTAILLYVDMLKWYWSNVLAPVAIWLYNNVIKPIWGAIKTAIAATINWFVNTGWPILKAAWDAVALAAKWLYQNVILPVWNSIKAAIGAVVNWMIAAAWPIIKRFISWIGTYFKALKATLELYWAAIKWAINLVVSWFQNTAWPIIKTVIEYIKTGFALMRDSIKAAWKFIKERVIAPVAAWYRDVVWGSILAPTIDKIKTGFNLMRDSIKNAWNFIKDKVINPVAVWFRDTIKPLFDRALDGLKDGFNLFKDTVKKVWNGVRDTAKEPIKFLIETIIRDNIIKKYNEVANGIFGLDKVDEGKFTVGWRKGGILPGYTPMARGDDVLTPMRSGEGVLVSEGLRDKASRAMFLGANAAAKKGLSFSEWVTGQSGYAGGGLVKLRMPFAGSYPRGDGFGARGGKHDGIDWPMPHGAMLKAVAAGHVNHTRNAAAGNKLELAIGNGLVAGYHHLSSYIANNGSSVGRGADVARVGSTGRSSGPHLHFSLKKDGTYVDPMPYLGAGGAAGDGGGGFNWNPFEGVWESIKSKVREGVGNAPWGDTLFELPKKVLGGAVEWAANKLSEIGDFAVETGKTVAGVAGVTARWGALATKALSMTGDLNPLNHASMMRRMNQESGGNPQAINKWDSNYARGTPSKGLMQVIDPTFKAYAHPDYNKNIWDPLSNMLASIRYTKSAYGSVRKGWNRKGGYSLGGILPGFRAMHRGDDRLTPMRSGEGVMVSEGLRDGASRRAFLGANEAAKRGLSFADYVKGYAAGGIVGKISPTAKIGSTKVTVILDGLTGTEKQAKAAAGKLADGIVKVFNDRMKAAKTATVNKLSDSLSSLKKEASALKKTIKATTTKSKKSAISKLSDELDRLKKQQSTLKATAKEVKKTTKVVGKTASGKLKTKTVKVSTSDAKKAAKNLKGVQKQISSTQAALKKARRGDYSGAASAATRRLKAVEKQIATTDKALKAARRGDYQNAALIEGTKAYNKYAASGVAKLQKYAQTADKLAAKLKDANTKLKDARKLWTDYRDSMVEKFQGTYAFSEDTATTGIETIIRGFKNGAATVKTFTGQLAKLKKRGLSQGLVDQLAQMGAESGSKAAANLLTASDSQIKEISKQYNSLNKVSKQSGTKLADQMYRSGVDSAKGLVKGLESQLANVEKASEKLANKVISTVRKKLKIKSPSRVTKRDGGFIGQGYLEGITEMIPRVQRSLEDLIAPPGTWNAPYNTGMPPMAPVRPSSTMGNAGPMSGLTVYGGIHGHSADEVATKLYKKNQRAYALHG